MEENLYVVDWLENGEFVSTDPVEYEKAWKLAKKAHSRGMKPEVNMLISSKLTKWHRSIVREIREGNVR